MALKVLSSLDAARTQCYHFKAIVIAGMGLFTDAYDLFCIPPIVTLISRLYYPDPDPPAHAHAHAYRCPPAVVSGLVSVALAGTVLGQIACGLLGDRFGRRRVYGLALVTMVLASFACGFSLCSHRGCVLATLGLFRFLLGLGIGGDYPLSATIMSEFANKRTRGMFIAAVFSMQGLGILASSAAVMAVCSVFQRFAADDARPPPLLELDLAWRIILMLGAIPAALTLYWRMMMPETARYTALVEKNVARAAKNMERVLNVHVAQIAEASDIPPPYAAEPTPAYPLLSAQFRRRHGRDLLACAAAWFLVDVAFYSTNLFQSLIYRNYPWEGEDEGPARAGAFREAFRIAKFQAIVAACSTIPGYWAAVALIDRVGRVRIQMAGFLGMAAAYAAIGATYYTVWERHPHAGFLALYALTFFFSNLGPNTTTFIVPAELFPARFRTTCHGVSGAVGKVGAIIGSVGFLWASHRSEEEEYPKRIGMTAALGIMAGLCLLGAAVTYFLTPETMGRSLEENEH